LILALETNGDRLSAVTFSQRLNFDLSLVAALEPGNDPGVVSAFLRHFMSNAGDFIGDTKVPDYAGNFIRDAKVCNAETLIFFVLVENYQPHRLPRTRRFEMVCVHTYGMVSHRVATGQGGI
jgi:hypothetical protein